MLETGLRAATVLKANRGELAAAAGILGFPTAPASYFDAAPALQWLCVTHGEQGAELYRRSGEKFALRGASVDVVDTVGAGDAFTAGFVDALARGSRGHEGLEAAHDAAASVLARRGGLPDPHRD